MQAIFSFLNSSNDLKPTAKLTSKDLSVGIPNLLLSLEMVIFALSFLYIYRTKEYYFKHGASVVPLGHGGYQGGFLGISAYGEAMNIADILRGIISVPQALAERKNSSLATQKVWTTGAQVRKLSSIRMDEIQANERRGGSMKVLK
jgi:Organic solute transporter Ostalpha